MAYKLNSGKFDYLNNQVKKITEDITVKPYGIYVFEIGSEDIEVTVPIAKEYEVPTFVLYKTQGGKVVLKGTEDGIFDGADTIEIVNVGQNVILKNNGNSSFDVDDGVDIPVPNAPVVSVTSPTTDKTPTFTYTNTGTHYRVRIGAEDWRDNVANLSYTPASDLELGSHVFSVQATDDDVNFGSTGSKTVVIEAISVPNNPTISVSTPTTDTTPTFTWTATGTYYQTKFDDGAWSASTTDTSFTPTEQALGTHTLKVRASDDDINWSDGENEVSVTIQAVAPIAPVLTLDTPTTDLTPTISMTAGADDYEIRVDSGEWLTTLDNTYTFPELALGEHTFEGRAKYTLSDWSDIGSLVVTLIEVVINPPTINQLADTGDTTPTVTWEAVAGATSYEVSIDDGSTFIDVGNVLEYTYAEQARTGRKTRKRCFN